ncbi:MAG TPA: serine/threonine-protein kinase [Caulobacteraceae bacterium]|nr:serine/threonine-protein kinase [Caulobacteraceae bacterium]
MAPASQSAPGRVSVGDVLNGIYEVKRLIGRGGMGEVYEGVNINSDERVAIKVMLPSLAADAKVQAMFRKEARTLTRLAHPAVVQYRVLAHEPLLNVLYIVTEFVDGVELTAILGQIHPDSTELRRLIRRLADGLRAAHELGAVHRDMSPDNILLPDRRLDRARIIDFGIAKDLDPSKATIVGDGFAGKLAYVAPEQFGDFGREIGPWTDIYSLGLVILAVATGRDVDMGSTLVEAVDKRRQGVDLTPIPEDLRPIMERMLAADPAKRARSMDEVLAMLDAQDRPPTIPPGTAFPRETSTPPTTTLPPATLTAPVAAAPVATTLPPHAITTPPKVQPLPRPAAPAKGGSSVVAIVLIGLVTVAIAAGAIGFVLLQHKTPPKPVTPSAATPSAPAAGPAAPATTAASAVSDALPGLSCSWLDVVGPVQGGQPVKLSGASGSPATAQDTVTAAAQGAGVMLSAVDIGAVAQADQGACSALDAFRSFKAPVGGLASAQPAYQITRGADGKLTGQPTITLAPRSVAQDFALLRMDTFGRISVVYGSRQAFDAARQGDTSIVDQGGDAYTVQADALNVAGTTGLLLLTGKGPFDPSLLAKPPGARDVTWIDQVRQAATAGGWKASMAWYKVQNNAAPVRPKARPGYYAHPGADTDQPTQQQQPEAVPIRTQPQPPAVVGHRQSVWQRMFGSGQSH